MRREDQAREGELADEPASPLHPAAMAWEALIAANEALEAAKAAQSGSLYRSALLVTFRRARQYERAVGALLEELGE